MRSVWFLQVGRLLGGFGVFIALSILALLALVGFHYAAGGLEVTTLQSWQRPAVGWSAPLSVQRVAGPGGGPAVAAAGSPGRAALVVLDETGDGDRTLTIRELDLAGGEPAGEWRLDLPASRISTVSAVAWAPGPEAPSLRSGWGLHLALVDRAAGSPAVRYVLWEPERGPCLDITLSPPEATGTDAAIALGPDGGVHLAWSQFGADGYSIHYAPVLRGAAGAPACLNTPGVRSRSPSLAVTADGAVWVAWLEFEAGGLVRHLTYTGFQAPAAVTAAASPADPRRIDVPIRGASQPQVVCLDPGAAGCIFVNRSSSAGRSMVGGVSEDLFFVALPPAAGEAAVRRLTDTASYIRGLAAAPASAGGAHLAWMDARGNDRDVLYLRLDDSGRPVGEEALLSPSFGGDVKPGLADVGGRPVVVWLTQDAADGTLLVERDTFRPRPVSRAYTVGLGAAPLISLAFGWAVALFRAGLETAVNFIPLVIVGLLSAWLVGRTGIVGRRRLAATLALLAVLGTAAAWPTTPWAHCLPVLPSSWTEIHHLGCAAAATLLTGLLAAARRLEIEEWLSGLFLSAVWFFWFIYLGVVPRVLQFN